MLAASLVACNGQDATGERLLDLEAKTHALEESLETLADENAHLSDEVATVEVENVALKEELAVLRQQQAEFVEQQEAAEAARQHEEEVADFEDAQEQQLADLETGQANTITWLSELDEQVSTLEEGEAVAFDWLAELVDQIFALQERQDRTGDRSDDLDTRVEELEYRVSRMDAPFTTKQEMSQPSSKPSTETALEKTRRLAEEAGGEVYNIDSREPQERAILVMPLEPIEGNPLIVSLHGYGSNSAAHSSSFPLHTQVVSLGFGLLLPNGTPDGRGNRFWNPTDQISSSGKAFADDAAYLAGLVARARELKDFGPVYVFGYSNGGFMAYHLACRGLPGLRAVASIAGTSYVDDASCEDAPPVSVLHIHGTADDVILYEGEVAEPLLEADGDPAAYASAQDMVMRWGRRAGCEWPKTSAEFAHYAVFDLDKFVRGPETYAFRLESGCADGIDIQLWQGVESDHTPFSGGYIAKGDA